MNPNQTPDQPPYQPQNDPTLTPPVTPAEPTLPEAPTPPETPAAQAMPTTSSFQPNTVVAGDYRGVVDNAPLSAQPPFEPPKKSRRKLTKKKALLIGGPLLVLLLIAGAVFGLYLPNTPGNVYKTGISRTGEALEKVVATGTEADKLEAYATSEITGDFKATADGTTYAGDLVTKFDDATSDTMLGVNLKGGAQPDRQFGAQLLTDKAADKSYPDIYLKLTGLSSFGLDSMVNTAVIENRWIVVSAEYLESLASSFTTSAKAEEPTKEPTAADIAELANTVTAVTREYFFGTDPKKAIIEQRSYVGKETVDGVNTYHYKVAARSEQSADYCKELIRRVMATKAFKNVSGLDDEAIAKERKSAQDSCVKSIKENSKDDVEDMDLWIDSKYKLIYKIRAYDDKTKANYTEIGQNYKGGDDINLFGRYVEGDKSESNMTLTTNTKTNVTKFGFTYAMKEDGKQTDVEFNVTAKPSNGKVKITKPTDAVSIEQVLQELGLN